MIESFFDVKEEYKTRFSSLPLEAKKAVITRWGFEGEGMGIPKRFFNIDVLSEDDWSEIIKEAEAFIGCAVFYYFEVPTEDVKQIILDNLEGGDFVCWEDYSAFYGLKDVPEYPRAHRWPCLSCSGDDEVLEDGWHRLHSYINNNDLTIPVLLY